MSEQQPKEKKKKKTVAKVVSATPSDVNTESGVTPLETVTPANEAKKKKKKTVATSKSGGKKTTDDDALVVIPDANNNPVALQENASETVDTPFETEHHKNVRALLTLSEKEVEDSVTPLVESSQRMSRPTSRGKAMDRLNSPNADKLTGQVSIYPFTSSVNTVFTTIIHPIPNRISLYHLITTTMLVR